MILHWCIAGRRVGGVVPILKPSSGHSQDFSDIRMWDCRFPKKKLTFVTWFISRYLRLLIGFLGFSMFQVFVGTTPHPVTVTTRTIPFLVGNPNLNLHLWLESWVGETDRRYLNGWIITQKNTKHTTGEPHKPNRVRLTNFCGKYRFHPNYFRGKPLLDFYRWTIVEVFFVRIRQGVSSLLALFHFTQPQKRT